MVTPPLFQQFLQYYINRHARASIGYEVMRKTWEDFIYANIEDPTQQQTVINAVNWELWIYEGGLPPKSMGLDFTNPDQILAAQLADAYISLGGASSPSNYKDYDTFYANQKVLFLLQLINRSGDISIKLIERID